MGAKRYTIDNGDRTNRMNAVGEFTYRVDAANDVGTMGEGYNPRVGPQPGVQTIGIEFRGSRVYFPLVDDDAISLQAPIFAS